MYTWYGCSFDAAYDIQNIYHVAGLYEAASSICIATYAHYGFAFDAANSIVKTFTV